MHNETDHARPLLGRIVGWNAVFAALVAAALIAASMIQLRSGAPLSAGAEVTDSAAADVSPATALPAVAAAPIPAQSVTGGVCIDVSDSAEFEVGESRTLTVAGFDTSLGELNTVTVMTSVSFVSAGSVTNVGVVPFDFESFPSRTFEASVSRPGITGVLIDRTSPLFTTAPIPASDTVDISVGSAAETNTETDAVADYLSGPVSFSAPSTGDIAIVLGPNADATIRSTVVASVKVTYCYTPAPPPVSSEIVISKAVVAGPGADVPIFTFSISCDGGFTTTASLSSGSTTVTLDGVPAGTACDVTESDVDTGRWSTEVNGTCGTSATVLSDSAENTAAFINTLRAGSETPLGACG